MHHEVGSMLYERESNDWHDVVPFAHALLMLQVSRVLPPVCTASQAEALALMSQRSSEGYLVEMLEGLLLVAFAK
jgi:hypothetical protein